ncbi:MAG: hypothetical protein ACE5NM_04990 [Sedimentisphaerales bacterium]
MKLNVANTSNRTNRFLARLTAERKKTVLAFCLIAVMAFMWVRVLSRKAPDAVEAALMTQQQDSNDQPLIESGVRISFVELPKVTGRNDVITRDFFDPDGWRGFIKDKEEKNLVGYKEVDVTSHDDKQEVLNKIAGKLKLEAIELGEDPRAFINGRLLSVGDKLHLQDGLDSYECEVVQIEQNLVRLACSEVEITLRLMPIVEVID